MIKKVLIANRGEIALRIMKTLREMKIQSVALYTEMEAADLHVKTADEAFSLGNGNLSETWLNIARIIDIAKNNHVDAIHPGYGFLSENARFAKACEEAGIIFIGPQSDVIEKMGSKILASHFAVNAGIPLLPRIEGTPSELTEKAEKLGYPLLVKAAAGGGGKGMIRVDTPGMLEQAVFAAAEQARRYFDDDKVYIEKYVINPRHIEVQVLADHHGNIVHLHERECTLQRNHQKVVEEAPSVSLNDKNRNALHQAAVNLAAEVGYRSAGTVEFILDEEGNFYFLEMNTRIQVEHPITEMITGTDIVREQIEIASGKPLPFTQKDIKATGHSIEVRLYAEDPAENFRPSAGTVKKLLMPVGNGIRADSAIKDTGSVHPSFDGMIAKIVVGGEDRQQAIGKMTHTLDQLLIHGITTNRTLLRNIMIDKIYHENQISTHSIADNLKKWSVAREDEKEALMAAALFLWIERYGKDAGSGAWRMAATEKVRVNQQEKELFYHALGGNGLHLSYGNHNDTYENILIDGDKLYFDRNKKPHFVVFNYSERNAMFLINGVHYQVILPEAVVVPKIINGTSVSRLPDLKASLFGKVLRVNVAEKQRVKSGEPLLVLESMKMENTILAPDDNIISRINVKEGDQVSDGQVLISFES